MSDPSYQEHLGAVRAYLSASERDPQVRADVEEAFAERAGTLKPSATAAGPVRSFFVGVAANLLRQHRRQRALEERTVGALARIAPPPVEDPEAQLARKEEVEQVLSGLSQLPKAHRDALVLTAVEGLSMREAATHEGVPEATLRTRVFWARKNLESLLGRAAVAKRTRAAAVAVVVALLSGFSFAMYAAWQRWQRALPTRPLKMTPSVPAPAPTAPALPPQPAAPPPEAAPSPPSGRVVRPATPVARANKPSDTPIDLGLYDQALALQLQSRNDEAARAWSQFIAAAPPGPYRSEARYRRALAWARAGQWSKARPELEALIGESPGSGLATDAARLLSESPAR